MIANAVLHRSYLDKSCVQVCLYDNRLEVSSPGMLYGGLDLKTAKLGKSTCRNEAIAEAFHYMHIVEAWGTGIPRIINRCKEYGLPEPLFEEFGDGFKVTMFRKVSNASEKVSNAPEKVSNASEKVSNAPEKVSNTFEKYISLFEEAQVTDTFINNIEQVFRKCGIGIPFGQTNVMEWLDCSKSKATNIMNAMKAAKVIKKVTGVGPGKYEFVEI
jgi:predicted HTH transcriptional regulator